MSLPLLLSLADELDNLNNDYGFGYYHPHAHQPRHYGRPLLRLLLPETESRRQVVEQRGKRPEGPVSNIGKDGFQVCMDVQQFKPSELVVKTVDNCVVVEGKHEEREDEHGFITRHFVRRYALPKGYDPNQVVSTLSSDGVLTVKVPPPAKSVQSNERIVQIQQTGPAHLSVKDNPKEDEEKSKDKEAEKK